MMFIKYRDTRIQDKGLVLIGQVNEIIEGYRSQGYSLTLRQVYYRLVGKGLIENNMGSYKQIGTVISNGRLTGLIDWQAIEDRTRHLRTLNHWDSPAQIMTAAASSYQRDLWEGQPFYVECWVEKDALIGVVEQAANRWDVPCFSCRGFASQTEVWAAAQRMRRQAEAGRECVIIYMGDHDPSGQEITVDIGKRLTEFGAHVEVNRIALNMDQVRQYNPPPQPAKMTDTRSKAYVRKYGELSWELDALEPAVLDGLITDTIKNYLDQNLYDMAVDRQEQERASITFTGDSG
jgi:hypothetical protein